MIMGFSSILLLLFFIILIHFVSTTTSQPDFVFPVCADTGNYTSNSVYRRNLQTLLSSISSNTQINYGFYNFSEGEEPDKVDAIALCRGDVKLADCRKCVNDSTHKILQVCPEQKEAMGFYEHCMLRYSNNSIFGIMNNGLKESLVSLRVVSNVNEFNQTVRNLLDRLRRAAASGNSIMKFATGEAAAPNFQTIYGLVQCTPDLSEQDCTNCLDQIAQFIPACCNGKDGARVASASCNLRYEISRFYDSVSPEPPPGAPPPPENAKKSSNTNTIVIAIVVPTVSLGVLIIICIFYGRKRQKYSKPIEKVEMEDETSTMDEISYVESLQFDFGSIKAATDDFNSANKLGQGGFGAVYRGRLPNGKDIAVKRLAKNSGQGDLELKNEVLLVAKLQHRNLVKLLGFCLEGSERLLVYEFVPNASLDHFIFDPVKRTCLNWESRYKIIGGIARGLLYLHEDSRLRIIHRDLKASNILLDTEMNPKISDFGMARLFAMDETQGNTSRIVGTYGYMAPEYAMYGQFSTKSDVYSFGVLVLELVSGQKNNSFQNGKNTEDLLSFAWRNWRSGTASNLIDPTLNNSSRNEMMRCIHIGLLCVQENVADRPTMGSVVLMLNSYSLTLPVVSVPAFSVNSGIDESRKYSASTSGRQPSANEASFTQLFGR